MLARVQRLLRDERFEVCEQTFVADVVTHVSGDSHQDALGGRRHHRQRIPEVAQVGVSPVVYGGAVAEVEPDVSSDFDVDGCRRGVGYHGLHPFSAGSGECVLGPRSA